MAATSQVNGLVSGLDTSTIISQLMSIEKQPQDALKQKQTDANTMVGVYQQLNTNFSTLQSAALSLSRVTDWKVMKATSSSPNVTASATSAASTGALTFTVQQLSRAGSVATAGTVASTSVVVANGPVLLAKGADVLGIGGLAAGAGLTIGAHTVEVTQATAGASVAGTAPLAASTTFAADATLDVTVDGVAKSYTIAAGTYSAAQLAAAVQTASGGDLTASVGSDGRLSLMTTHEGSAASLSVTGGSAAASLSLDTSGTVATGADGTVSVDGGPAITVNSAGPGVAQSLAGANGAMTATFAGALRLGKATLVNVDPGNGSLSALVDAVNASGAGISAAAVNVGTGAYRLQFSSTTNGAGSNISVDGQNLGAALGSFATVQAGRDAVVKIGEGAGAYTVSSASDTLTGLLPGVTIGLTAADPNTAVTVTVGQDGSALADAVGKLVDAANTAVTFINQQSTYDTDTKQAGLLLGDPLAASLQSQIYSAISNIVPGAKLVAPNAVGISLAKDGTISFDKNAFLTAYNADPNSVAALFQAGGSATDSHVSFLTASATTQPGTYAVDITQPATQAEADGTALSGAGLASAETIDVRVGGASGTTASYTAAAGASLDTVAGGLNAAFAEKGLALSAQVVSGALVVRSANYGSGASFEVRTSAVGAAGDQTGLAAAAGVWESHAGLDVAGTINGVASTGTGQVLMAPATDHTLGGLALTVTATAAGAYGTFTYAPGAAQRLNMVASGATDFATGSITNAINSENSLIKDLTDQISDWDQRLQQKQDMLQTQFANLETALGQLKDQSSWLSGQLASLPTGSA